MVAKLPGEVYPTGGPELLVVGLMPLGAANPVVVKPRNVSNAKFNRGFFMVLSPIFKLFCWSSVTIDVLCFFSN